MPKKKPQKSKRRNKSHIKHKEFEDLNITPLEKLKLSKGNLPSPFSALGDNIGMTSWRDNGLNEMLWAALIRANFEQEVSIRLFNKIIINAREADPDHKDTYITHSVLSVLDDKQFDFIMMPVLENPEFTEVLSSLLYLECLPDKHHWERHLNKPANENSHSEYLMKAIAFCMEHQSQEATDIRWFRLMYFISVQQRLFFPESMSETLEGFRRYPNYGDQRKIRPSIRAMEIMLRAPHDDSKKVSEDRRMLPHDIPPSLLDEVPLPWADAFWDECLEKTDCILGDTEITNTPERNKHYFEEFIKCHDALSMHFMANNKSTALDARKDGAYGLTLYALSIAISVCNLTLDSRAESRIFLRTIVECYITLKYLAHHDNQTIWEQYRNYGTGQSKLAFLKNLKEESIPDFISLKDLHTYSNEDLWQEYSNIRIKPWSEKNLRKMSEEAGVKDFYDKYYDWSSGYVHGNWGAVRDTVFTVCLNPLHRFHRIPFTPRMDMPSVLEDCAKIINLMLDINNQLHSPFKNRVKHYEN